MKKPSTSGKSTYYKSAQYPAKHSDPAKHSAPQSNPKSANLRSVSPESDRPSQITVKTNHSKSYEILVKIFVNFLLTSAAIAGLVKLIPNQSEQISKLQDLEREVIAKEKTVNCLKDRFSQSFDLGASQAASLREKGLISTTQRPIKFSGDSSPSKQVSVSNCN